MRCRNSLHSMPFIRHVLQIFSSRFWFVYFFDSIFWWAKDFIFKKVQFINFFLMVHDPSKNSLPAPRSWRYFSKPSFSSFMVLAFRFKFMIHFKLVSMDGLRFFTSYRYTAVPEALVRFSFPKMSFVPCQKKSFDLIHMSLSYGWLICLSFCQYHTFLITVAV